jgi:hypothetical protein
MAEIEANVIPLTSTTCKLKFINFDAPKSAGITSITYDSTSYDVIFDVYDNNSYVVVDASFADFNNETRVIIEADIPDPPATVGRLRVPTNAEWDSERLTWSTNNASGGFASSLKITNAGSRRVDGLFDSVGIGGRYWSSDVSGDFAGYLTFSTANASVISFRRSQGFSVRLIVDGTFTQEQFNSNYLSQTIDIEGLSYGYVYNPTTGKIWIDRNLGATKVATSVTDTDAYGWLYQWGRLTDGHQIRTSSTSSTRSSEDVPVSGNYIITLESPFDWRDPKNDNLWQGIDGINNPANS